jgi:Tfp pilus assembly protein PilV
MPKPYVAQYGFVMIRTFSARLRFAGRSSNGRGCLASQAGDTLIEVLIGSLLLGIIATATLSGLNSSNRVTALQRARSQADALAQQNEEQMRSEPIKKLLELEGHPETKTVTQNGTVFTITTGAEYIADATSTSSCNSSSPNADYLQTTSKVTWPALVGKAVVENGVISPPAGAALIVQVTTSGTALEGAQVTATGPSPETTQHTLETSSKGCAILALSPGEYSINVDKSGYVDPNGYANSDEDLSSSVTRSVYLPAETTAKEGYYLGRAGKLEVSYTGAAPAEGDTFVAYNTGMTSFRTFGVPGTYATTVVSQSPSNIYPFPTSSPYTVYAGTCEADLPTNNGQSSNPSIVVEPGTTAKVSVPLAAINIKVLSSNKGLPETALQNAAVRLADTGCGTVRTFKTTSTGALLPPGMPFGAYSLCVTGTVGTKSRKYTRSISNNSSSGTALQKIYLGEEGEETTASCP